MKFYNLEGKHKSGSFIITEKEGIGTMKTVFAFIVIMGFSGCGIFGSSTYAPLDVVSHVDLTKYAGKWYEIASLPVSQQKGCSCTTAEYIPIDTEVIKVINTCRKGSEGEISRAEGKAYIVPGSNNAKLRVQFFRPFRGDYWILDLDENYTYAVVGLPSRKYCWILSRTPEMKKELLDTLTEGLRLKGFEVGKMQRTVHNCQ
jgi:apolipoprotein D and lipocalin family protein